MNVKDAAATLGVSTQRVYQLLKAGTLRGTRTPSGRRWKDVDEASVAHYQRGIGGYPGKEESRRPLLVADYQTLVTPDGTALGNLRKRVASFADEHGTWEIKPSGELAFTGAFSSLEEAVAALMEVEA